MILSVADGWAKGERINGKVAGAGADWALLGSDGWARVDVRGQIVTDDGAVLYLTYTGVMEVNDAVQAALDGGETSFDDQYFRTDASTRDGRRALRLGQPDAVRGARPIRPRRRRVRGVPPDLRRSRAISNTLALMSSTDDSTRRSRQAPAIRCRLREGRHHRHRRHPAGQVPRQGEVPGVGRGRVRVLQRGVRMGLVRRVLRQRAYTGWQSGLPRRARCASTCRPTARIPWEDDRDFFLGDFVRSRCASRSRCAPAVRCAG